MKPADVSYNFHVAKVLSILMVATGHYFGGLLWIPTTIALFIFAFSSGYFSALKYRGDFSIGKFWTAKILRLGYSLLFINAFLVILFLFQGRTGIFSFDSVLGMFGLSAALSWFGLPYHSPFGEGLWFLTVLWLFYLAYPLVERINRNSAAAFVFMLSMLFITTILSAEIKSAYTLWMVVFAFLFAVCFLSIASALLLSKNRYSKKLVM